MEKLLRLKLCGCPCSHTFGTDFVKTSCAPVYRSAHTSRLSGWSPIVWTRLESVTALSGRLLDSVQQYSQHLSQAQSRWATTSGCWAAGRGAGWASCRCRRTSPAAASCLARSTPRSARRSPWSAARRAACRPRHTLSLLTLIPVTVAAPCRHQNPPRLCYSHSCHPCIALRACSAVWMWQHISVQSYGISMPCVNDACSLASWLCSSAIRYHGMAIRTQLTAHCSHVGVDKHA